MENRNRLFEMQAEFLRAIAHPTRLQILELLQRGELCVCDIMAELELEQSNVSQHLAVLKRQDLVSCRKEGLKAIYSVGYPQIYELLDASRRILRTKTKDADNLLKEGTVK